MGFNAVFQGAPANVPSPGAAAALGIDETSGTLYYTSPQSAGWKPALAGSSSGFSGTIVTAALTTEGTQGSITVVNGVITAVVAAT